MACGGRCSELLLVPARGPGHGRRDAPFLMTHRKDEDVGRKETKEEV